MNLLYLSQLFNRITKWPLLRRRGLGLAIILITWLAFFSRTLLGRAVYFLDDLKSIYYPLETAYATFQQAGALPQWSPLFGFGQPLMAWGQLGFFTPFHLLLRAFSLHPLILLQASILFYFALGLLGMYVFASRLGLSQMAASLSAIIFTFSGFNVGHLNHVNFYTGTMILPWLLLSIYLFLIKPTLLRSLLLSLLASTIILSSQPQVTLYTIIIAAIIGLSLLVTHLKSFNPSRSALAKYLFKAISLTILAAILTLGLSSFATLPLLEFLPQTERSAGMDELVLYEFSYPPQHAITLIFPFLFGGHDNYWGAKGFQELAAYIGIIPLLLLGPALASRRRYLPIVLGSVILILISLALALGEFSFIYEYLVSRKYITSLAVPGRFIYFFIVAVSILAGIGLDSITRPSHRRFSPTSLAVPGLLIAALFLTPFIIDLRSDTRLYQTLLPYLTLNPSSLLFLGGLLLFILVCFLPRSTTWSKTIALITVLWTAGTLIIFGWNYNPLTDPKIAFASPNWYQSIREYNDQNSTPARLYASIQLLRAQPEVNNLRKTESLSPALTLFQPITAQYDNISCLSLPVYLQEDRQGTVLISVYRRLDQPPLREIALQPDLLVTSDQRLCFSPIVTTPGEQLYIKLSSDQYSGFRLFLYPTDNQNEQILLIRKPDYQLNEVLNARKPLRLLIQPEPAVSLEGETAIGSRHLNVIANASSARWIGSLSIRPYREFIEMFFANDREQFDGDGFHVIQSQRRLFDLAGVTHFTQHVPLNQSDTPMTESNFTKISEELTGPSNVALYQNPSALPRAFLTPQAIFQPADDEARTLLLDPNFDPFTTAIINGPTPPDNLPLPDFPALADQVDIINYQPTRVDINVSTNRDAFLILSDSSTSQWHTLIDGQPAPRYTAYTFFRAAFVPAGNHTITFYYYSPAIAHAKSLTIGSLLIILLLFLLAALYKTPGFNRLTKHLQTRLLGSRPLIK